MKTKMNYKELKEDYQKQVDSLHFMVGFSKKWVEELFKLKKDHQKVYNIWGGCYANEENYQKLNQFTKDFETYIKNKIKEQDEEFVKGAVYYEMSNYEYPYSRDAEEVLNALGLDEKIFEDKWFTEVWTKAEKQLLSDYDW